MGRYDTSLAVERGAVRSGMSPNRNDYYARSRYGRDLRPRNTHFWRRPSEVRGDVRGGSAFSYGFGNDYDAAMRTPRNQMHTPHGWEHRPRPAGYWGPWLGAEGYPGPRGYDRGYQFRRGYDLGYRGGR